MKTNAALPLIDRIRDVLKRDNVSMAELSRLDGFRGTLVWESSGPKFSNVIVWANMSAEAADAIATLQQNGECHTRPTTPLTYLIDGVSLQMPIVKSIRHYKEPHWLPVVLKVGPDPDRRDPPKQEIVAS